MPRRNFVLGTGEIYHVFNRTIGNENIFLSRLHLRKILEIARYYQYPQTLRLSKFKLLNDAQKQEYMFSVQSKPAIVELFAYAFMPNHFHFLLKQLQDKGIQKYISAMQNSFAKYYNLKLDRHGGLFQEQFKANRIENDNQLLHVSRYIHLNPVTSFLIGIEELTTYPWTSFSIYQSHYEREAEFINVEFLIKLIGNYEKYKSFVFDQADYQRNLAVIKNLI